MDYKVLLNNSKNKNISLDKNKFAKNFGGLFLARTNPNGKKHNPDFTKILSQDLSDKINKKAKKQNR